MLQKIFIVVVTIIALCIGFALSIVTFFVYFMWIYLYMRLQRSWLTYWIYQPEFVRKAFPVFDINGLRHNTKYLDTIKTKIVFWSVEEQAKYVDWVVYDAVKNNVTFFRPDLIDEKDLDFNLFNATSVGNMAYVSLYHKDEEERLSAKAKLHSIKDHYEALLGKQ